MNDRPSAVPPSGPFVQSSTARPLVLATLVLAAALSRLLPHPPNFTPVGAMALFAGVTFRSRLTAVLLPLAAMAVSDLAFLALRGWGFGWMTLIVYSCIAASVGLGVHLRHRGAALGVGPVAGASLLSATLFFLVTNFAVWAGGTTYPGTFAGLMTCYVAAVPFFGNTLAGYAVFGGILFGGFALLQRRFVALAPVAVRP